MHVEKILPQAQEGPVTIGENVAVVEAARCLRGPHASLAAVCDGDGVMRDVVSKANGYR